MIFIDDVAFKRDLKNGVFVLSGRSILDFRTFIAETAALLAVISNNILYSWGLSFFKT